MERSSSAERFHARYALALEAFVAGLPQEWSTGVHRDGPVSWRVCEPPGELPAQGWKLHVSASAADALDLLDVVLPALVEAGAAFKLPDDVRSILRINAGLAGRSQVGKIVTVYPSSDAALAALIDRLDAVWRPGQAPAVPSDLPVGPVSEALFIRYGEFTPVGEVVDSTGVRRPALRAPDGSLRPDVRDIRGRQPEWAVPPVRPADRPVNPGFDGPIEIDGATYLPLKLLGEDARGFVALGVRPADQRLVVIRHRRRGVEGDEFGEDVVTRLEPERRVLEHLSGSGLAPEPLAHDASAGYLVVSDVGGGRLERLPVEERLDLMPELAAAVARLHARGIVHRDLKLPNVRVGPDGLRLVDFELAAPIGTRHPVPCLTDGHTPPEGPFAAVEPAYDVYGLGSCLAHAVLGCCPGELPERGNAGRQAGLLLRHGQPTAAAIVRECHHPDPGRRPAAAQVAERLRAALPAMRDERAAGPSAYRGELDVRWARGAAMSAGTAARRFRPHGRHNAHDLPGDGDEGLNLGAAGIVVALATLDTALGTRRFTHDITGAATWLAERPPSPAHGLFTGDSGVAVALAVAGGRLGRADLVAGARRRFEHAAASRVPDYDLFSGAAGIVWAGCLLDAVLDATWARDLAGRQAGRIVEAARHIDGLVAWPSDPDLEPSGNVFLGAAHGTAGVAMALGIWGGSTGDATAVALAEDAFRGVATHGLTGDGTNILSTTTGESRRAQHWCHGMAGFLWCLLQANAGDDGVREAAVAAFDRATPLLDGPTMCHGLSGVLETWRMLQALPGHRARARRRVAQVADSLRPLHHSQDGVTVWSSESSSVVAPGLWLGFLGPATQLALAAAGSADPLLSARWLRRCARPVR
ncbi:lanthionine synthetase LanC family protein [Microbispora sp. H13382]|uniref:class III lanthionine synthetase LanKC N-terminal domain-containing protein n=1 Tax=Microbispora sp. H13382 TaxID=2729112 RepID=UPI0016019019|nr:lanthionine synthetase LanC family protein [Microbispora sp. H13382]